MATPTTLDRQMASQMVRIFDELYRRGVMDCVEADNEGRCREFLAATYEPGVYGLLTDDYLIGAREWQLRLQAIAGMVSLYSPVYRLFCRMGNYLSNYLGCFLPLASDFYRKGVYDALEYPGMPDMDVLAHKKRVWLTAKGFAAKDNFAYKQEVQQMCFNRKRMEETLMERYVDTRADKRGRLDKNDLRKRVRRPDHWDTFIDRIGVLTGY